MIIKKAVVSVSFVILYLLRDSSEPAGRGARATVHGPGLLIDELEEVLHLLLERLIVRVIVVDRRDWTLVLGLTIRIVLDLMQPANIIPRGDRTFRIIS